jgi:hypothetical protein
MTMTKVGKEKEREEEKENRCSFELGHLMPFSNHFVLLNKSHSDQVKVL